MAPAKARVMSRRRSAAVWTLLVLATLLLLVASMTVWSKRQLLNSDKFTNSASKVLANDEIRTTLASRLVTVFGQRVDLTSQLEQRFPRAESVVPVVAAAVRNAVSGVVDDFLASAKAQELWERAVRRAHSAMVNVLEGKDAGAISTSNGDVVLDLRPFISQIATQLGVEDRLKKNASPTSGEIVILKSDQLDAAQKSVRVLNALSSWLWLAVVALSRYSSLAALLASAATPVALWMIGDQPAAVLFTLLSVLLWIMHRGNIARLVRGTESKLGASTPA